MGDGERTGGSGTEVADVLAAVQRLRARRRERPRDVELLKQELIDLSRAADRLQLEFAAVATELEASGTTSA